MANKGKFIVSLDFEMMWGVRDKRTISSYGSNIIAVRTIIPRLIKLADDAGIHLTFGTVGMLMCHCKEDVLTNIPQHKPSYKNTIRSPYGEYIEKMTLKEEEYHFAPDLVDLIRSHPQHELASHTYCHYYCLEEGQNIVEFEEDIALAQKMAGETLHSIIFPRNQTNKDYLSVCRKHGFVIFRGNERNFLNKASAHDGKIKRALRLLDHYINLTGYNTYSDNDILETGELMNIPASRFLRPYISCLSFLDGVRLHRIKKAMTFAAKKGETYHLWWHPHNFGDHTEENFVFLNKVFNHYKLLRDLYGFRSLTFKEMYDYINNDTSKS